METNIKKIPYLDSEIEIIQWLSESDTQFAKRLEFIKKLEQKKVDIRQVQKLSNAWYCMKFKECVYKNELKQKLI
jgi:hypothetical protein